MTTRDVAPRAEDIPIGREKAITREQLRLRWGCSDRIMRRAIADMRAEDNGDGYIIVSYSSGKGYYRTSDPDEIRHFIAEQSRRARNTFLPIKKARRVLRDMEAKNEAHF